MSPDPRKAHEAVDRAVDRRYAPKKTFTGDTDRLVLLFTRYQRLTAAPGPTLPNRPG